MITSKPFAILRDGDLSLVPMDARHSELVRRWRNENSQWFFDSHFIEADEQLFWVQFRYLPDPSDNMWIIHLQGQPVGTAALTDIDLEHKSCQWARMIVGEPSARGQKVAMRTTVLVRDYALDILKMERIYGSLFASNEVMLHVNVSAGYKIVREHDGIVDVELLRSDHR